MLRIYQVLTVIVILILISYGLQIYGSRDKINIVNNQPLTTIASGLEVPWALAFLPDQNILVTERAGRVRLIKDGKLQEKSVANISVKQIGESGLHGIAIHPEFNTNHFVYLYYTYSAGNNNSLNRVSRFIFEDNILKDEQIIVDKIPGAVFHDGGRIKFGPASQGEPDGHLYITTGDALNPSLAQNKNSLAGKILRFKGDQVEVYSYGHRNPQGITWDNNGNLWETEHGQSATDEVNLIEAGKNYGWPTIRGEQKQQGMQEPKIQSGSDTWAPAGIAYYNGSLYFAGLRGQALYQLNIATLELKEHFKKQLGRIRDVVLGPDNLLYITTSNKDGRGSPSPDDDKIIRINPEKL
ncbi:MAG: PQQ-dependent sugar dehydrogenase [Patescibacteria group bacterium]